ncbi:hypothetical protein GGR51DRAFT_524919 [Nemania sp. FL0031]|nr:hypothetical protein GGR51DRAFT_524919 [Nemania sp. FL0031]
MMIYDTVDWDDLVRQSTSWPSDTGFGSLVHYLSAPAAGDYIFARDIPCRFEAYGFRVMHTCPAVTCLPFPSPQNSSLRDLKVVLTSTELSQELTDRLLSML